MTIAVALAVSRPAQAGRELCQDDCERLGEFLDLLAEWAEQADKVGGSSHTGEATHALTDGTHCISPGDADDAGGLA